MMSQGFQIAGCQHNIRIRVWLWVLLLLLPCLFSSGLQGQVPKIIARDTNKMVPIGYYVAYNSSLIYPGASAGINYPFREFSLSKESSNGRHYKIYKERMFSLLLGYYHHAGFHDNLYLVPGWLMRRTKSNGFFFDFWAGIGYSRTFLGGTTYSVDAAGNVKIIPLAGFNYCMIATGGGMGYDFTVKKRWPYSVFGRFDLLAMFPYNSTIYPRPAIELGVMYHPSHLFLTNSPRETHHKRRRR